MARPRRRHGRGGAPFTGEPNGLQPGDDAGNRRSFKQTQLPPENIGNKKDPEEEAWVPNDDLGNRIDAAPTHEISGVLSDMNGRRGRRKKGGQPHQRVGRYIVGGVNPVVAGNVQRTVEAMKEADERKQQERDQQRASGGGGGPSGAPAQSRDGGGGAADVGGMNGVDEEGRRGRRRRRRRRDGREQVDGQAAQEVSERRAQRFFDFEEDDRFEYVLKSDPAQKQKDAHDAVANVLSGAGRDAVVISRVLDDESRPKVIVTIDEKGPKSSLEADRRQQGSADPLFVLGNAALMSLNYLVNKIVNRYPDDRIRLAILPAADEKLYLESLEEHRRSKRAQAAPSANGAAGKAEPAPVATAPAALKADDASPVRKLADRPKEAPVALVEGEPESSDAEAAPAEKPKQRATPAKVKTPRSKKAAAEEDEGTGAKGEVSAAEPEAEAAAEDSAGRKATKKKSSAKVSTRSRAASEPEATTGTKKATKATAMKATAKKATAKKAPAKKTPPRKKAPSEG